MLNLKHTDLIGDLRLKKTSQLECLDLRNSSIEERNIEELIASCHSLQKLSLFWTNITPKMVNSICQQNGKSLKVLNLTSSKIKINDQYQNLDFDSVQNIFKNCVELNEVNLCNAKLSKESLDFLVENITPKIEKMSLVCATKHLNDDHVKSLVTRCKKLKELDLGHGKNKSISDASVVYITNNLSNTLEKLDFGPCENISAVTLFRQLESMHKLMVLRPFPIIFLKVVKKILPQLTLDENDETMHGFGYKIANFAGYFSNVNVVNMFPSKYMPGC